MTGAHPRWLALGFGVLFFALTLVVLWFEATASAERAVLLSGIRTLFAFVGGSGFTAWLSMTIYEYITSRNQERGWKHEFDVDRVRTTYGPLYDELKSADLGLLETFRVGNLHQTETLQRQHMSLLIPEPLLGKTRNLLEMVREYETLREAVHARMRDLALQRAQNYLTTHGGTGSGIHLGGGEWEHVLGATAESFAENYRRLIREVADTIMKGNLTGSPEDFENRLREMLNEAEEGQRLLQVRDQLRQTIAEIITELEPLIRAPYRH